MRRSILGYAIVLASFTLFLTVVRADEQVIAPGTGLQSSIVVDTGANGVCESVAASGDIQAA
ncbi:MAG: hypothetical protein ABIR79_24125, partial [Candidatus Binatia bacterium]